ncbi:spermidine synthase [Nocardioides sp. GXZ039]|uniref:spermidine synthase n=1 Tax=Nocardioides sp. GXZ039 TaxID=3136018 RepID=UPI0030F3F465
MIQRAVLPSDSSGAPGGFLVQVDGRDQSLVFPDDPTRLSFDYVRRMGDVLDALGTPGEPLRAVHVGGAGLTLPRYVAATRPRSRQIVLEPDEELTDLVRTALPLPPRSGIRIRPVDGRAGVASLHADYADVVVVDAYTDGEVPAELATASFLADLARVLTADGVVLYNLADRAPFGLARDVVAGLRAAHASIAVSAEPATLRGRRPGNLLLVAGERVPLEALQRSATTSAAPYRVLDERQVSDRLGGGRPRDDVRRPLPRL